MTEQSVKRTPANDSSADAEKLTNEQLEQVAGGTAAGEDRLAILKTKTIASPDSGVEPGEETHNIPTNAG